MAVLIRPSWKLRQTRLQRRARRAARWPVFGDHHGLRSSRRAPPSINYGRAGRSNSIGGPVRRGDHPRPPLRAVAIMARVWLMVFLKAGPRPETAQKSPLHVREGHVRSRRGCHHGHSSSSSSAGIYGGVFTATEGGLASGAVRHACCTPLFVRRMNGKNFRSPPCTIRPKFISHCASPSCAGPSVRQLLHGH